MAPTPCGGCGHAKRNHLNGNGLCLVRSCRLCLIYTHDPSHARRVREGGMRTSKPCRCARPTRCRHDHGRSPR